MVIVAFCFPRLLNLGKRGAQSAIPRLFGKGKSMEFITDKLQEAYLDWVNNFLSIEKFAEHYGLELDEAVMVIRIGRSIHERRAAFFKDLAA